MHLSTHPSSKLPLGKIERHDPFSPMFDDQGSLFGKACFFCPLGLEELPKAEDSLQAKHGREQAIVAMLTFFSEALAEVGGSVCACCGWVGVGARGKWMGC